MQHVTRQAIDGMIQREMAAAERARESGNDGMMRVCARRAAGLAITWWLQDHPDFRWGADAMSQLRMLQGEASMPAGVRDAAARLVARVSPDFSPPYAKDPLTDSKTIIDHLLSGGGT